MFYQFVKPLSEALLRCILLNLNGSVRRVSLYLAHYKYWIEYSFHRLTLKLYIGSVVEKFIEN